MSDANFGKKSVDLNALDKLNDATGALGAVVDLLIPEEDLHLVSRDNLYSLLNLILKQLENVQGEVNTCKPLT